MSSLFVEQIASEEALRQGAEAEDWEVASRFGSEHRRCEALAWRAIVRRELGADCRISYDEWGAPVVDSANTHISVSHCDKFVAVIISDHPCAVDIESLDRNFVRIAERYMSQEESQLCSDERWCAMVWCAKEALYKLYRKGGIDFLRDIKILSYDTASQSIEASLPDRKGITVKIDQRDGYIVARID